MAGKNLASKYSPKVDERFTRVSQAVMAMNNDYEFTGVDTVNVYSIPTAPMQDYQRTGNQRYGVPNDLQRNVQSLKVKRDRSFTFIIDKGDKIQSQMVSDAGKALSRQTNEVLIPEYDAYVFRTIAAAAVNNGAHTTKAISKSNAYECFLAGQERLGNHNVPDTGRVAFCSYKFANFLKQDSSFVRYGDKSQDMLVKGCIGECDGTKIVKVPSSRLPAGCAFILVHPSCVTAPKQLEDYKIHDNPPGINGWLVEGRFIYDCFVLDSKIDGVYYHGNEGVLKDLNVLTAPSATTDTNTVVLINGEPDAGARFVARYASSLTELGTPNWGDVINDGQQVESGQEVAAGYPLAVVGVYEVKEADNTVIGFGTAKIHTSAG